MPWRRRPRGAQIGGDRARAARVPEPVGDDVAFRVARAARDASPLTAERCPLTYSCVAPSRICLLSSASSRGWLWRVNHWGLTWCFFFVHGHRPNPWMRGINTKAARLREIPRVEAGHPDLRSCTNGRQRRVGQWPGATLLPGRDSRWPSRPLRSDGAWAVRGGRATSSMPHIACSAATRKTANNTVNTV